MSYYGGENGNDSWTVVIKVIYNQANLSCPIGSMVYLPKFTIKINQMWVNIPYITIHGSYRVMKSEQMTGMLLYHVNWFGQQVFCGEWWVSFFPRWRGGTKLQRLTCNLLFGMTYSSNWFFPTHSLIIQSSIFLSHGHLDVFWNYWCPISQNWHLGSPKKTKSMSSCFKWNVVIFFSKGGILQVPCGSHEQKPISHMNHKVLVGWLTETL